MSIISSPAINTKVVSRKDIDLAITYLQEHLLQYDMESLFNKIESVKDIYIYRYTLKKIDSSEKSVALITDIILTAIQGKQKFRTLDCLKVLRSLIKHYPEECELSEETISKLFEIYKHFIFSGREDVQWCVSSIIKDKTLGDEAIDWLVSNQLNSKHIVNRLLLYPHPHPKIKNWAEQILSEDGLPDRRSELIAILIENDLPKAAYKEDSSTIQWAIFKSRLPNETKAYLLTKYSDFDSLQATVEIADRLNYPDIVRNLLAKLTAGIAQSNLDLK